MTASPALVLDARDRSYLAGDHGPGAALAMRVLVAVARAMGAERLIDIDSAHVDGCIYIGPVSIDFARRLVEGGAKVSVPTTLNVGAVDLLHPELWNGDAELAARGRELMDLYAALGCSPTWTCAPYQLSERPGLGAHVAWGESNAIVFANSVLGARTQRYGDFVDIAAAIVGRAPLAGLHLDSGRRAEVVIDVRGLPPTAFDDDAVFPLLGHVVGEICGSRIPVVVGVPEANEDQLKAFGAASASSGAVALFHVVGVTPEAPTLESVLPEGDRLPIVDIGVADLRRAFEQLCTRADGRLAAVCLGTPHYSIRQFEILLDMLDDRRVHENSPLYVNTGRFVYHEIETRGWAAALGELGVRIVTDTCTYNTPILGKLDGLVMTDSAKWAWYAPRNVGVDVLFANLRSCVESAVEGRIVREHAL
ncbi:aconitase X catalytic domain-containing protein [Nocardia sp. BMG51109]|uniref:aconitase X n=1 Tax=Nocardia sp. BMG51109 TaxID=1056816 RepID=UPI00046345CC|nr:aconitase X catalytic domain-containing protein [Nocardia sp. BMG51109]